MHTLFGKCFRTTNIIESANSSVARYTRHITRWTTADQQMRWTAIALMKMEPSWNKIHNYRRLPMLQRVLTNEINQRLLKQNSDSKPSRISTRKRIQSYRCCSEFLTTKSINGCSNRIQIQSHRDFQLESGHSLEIESSDQNSVDAYIHALE
jgi:hypothetical protein